MRTDDAIAGALAKQGKVLLARGMLHAGASKTAAADAAGMSVASLYRWMAAYDAHGLEGLIKHCDRSGRPSVADAIARAVGPDGFEQVVAKVTGMNYDYQSNSLSWRKLADDPEAPGPVKTYMKKVLNRHGSKHTIARSLTVQTRLTKAQRLCHRGKKALRLYGFHIPRKCDVIPGDVYVSDDETDIVICAVPVAACEKYPHGWKAMQVQTFPMLDFASQYVGAWAHVARERGSYRATDLWGFFGHAIDKMKLPRLGFQFERGTWESNLIRGVKVDYDPAEPSPVQRVGGLQMLPSRVLPWHLEHAGERAANFPKNLQIFTSYTPKSKPVEGWFHRSQRLRQAFWGYAGRDQRKAPQEKVLKILQACQRGTLVAAEHFMTFMELHAAYTKSVAELNEDRMEGDMFCGVPRLLWEEWTQKPGFEQATMPERTAWMYRNAWAQGVIKGPFVEIRVTDEMTRRRRRVAWSAPRDFGPYDGAQVTVYFDRDALDAPAQVLLSRTGQWIAQAEALPMSGAFLSDDTSALDDVKVWERFQMTAYGAAKPYIPSLQKPAGVAERQAEAKRAAARSPFEISGGAAEPVSAAVATGPGPASGAGPSCDPPPARLPRIRSRLQLLEA